MPASTASTCFRSASESVHSQKSSHASSRFTSMRGTRYPAGAAEPRSNNRSMAFATLSRPQPSDPDWTLRMEKFVIEGGTPLSGSITPAGNKNAALPALAACLLTEEEVVLRNIPRIRDVEDMLGLLTGLGVEVAWRDENVVSLRARSVDPSAVDAERATRIRASFLCAGPLLARFRRADMPMPGGDVIGRRRPPPPPHAFRSLGAEVAFDRRGLSIEAPGGTRATDFFMDEPSVMATENALMAAALTPGSTVIHNA